MNAQRLAALVATIALIAGAFAIRRMIDEEDADAVGTGGTDVLGNDVDGSVHELAALRIAMEETDQATQFPGSTTA